MRKLRWFGWAFMAILVIGTWVRSFYITEQLSYRWGPTKPSLSFDKKLLYLFISRGQLLFSRWELTPQLPVGPRKNGFVIESSAEADRTAWRPEPNMRWSRFGVAYSHEDFYGGSALWLRIPFWLLAVAGLSTMLIGWSWRTSQVTRYDLRATPARCPECGTESRQNAQ